MLDWEDAESVANRVEEQWAEQEEQEIVKLEKRKYRRTSFCLSKKAQEDLEILCDEYGENKSNIINRAIALLKYKDDLDKKHITKIMNQSDP
jgi:hypothetical protein